jgi:HB1, ASXL, restriction endonuclease HTH domain
MTFLEAAYQVLKSSGRPLTTLEITERALEQGLVDPCGKTPRATMSAALYRALHSSDSLVKLCDPGTRRARRGTVRWTTRSDTRDV